MTGITIDFDLSDIAQKVEAFDRELVLGVQRAVTTAAEKGMETSKRTRRYKDRTGKLTGGAKVERGAPVPRGAESVMVWDAPYASFVDGGTRPHTIRARNAPWLVFFWPRVGRVVAFKSVNHPGTRPTGFAGVAYHQAEQTLQAECEAAAERAARKL